MHLNCIPLVSKDGFYKIEVLSIDVTTHSNYGVTNIEKMYPIFQAMADYKIILCIHGEISDVNIDIFDKEKVFIKNILVCKI